jgi:hypothetical protein
MTNEQWDYLKVWANENVCEKVIDPQNELNFDISISPSVKNDSRNDMVWVGITQWGDGINVEFSVFKHVSRYSVFTPDELKWIRSYWNHKNQNDE